MPEVTGQLVSGDVAVGILVDLFEDIDRNWSFFDVEKFNLEVKSGTARNEIAGALLAIAKICKI